jgi:eukaryotic-like serine/threonine-protein kinase
MGDTLTQIGRYEISRQLVDTALASVYDAFDPVERKPVAIRIPRTTNHGTGELKLGLCHPGLMTVLSYEQSQGENFAVLEPFQGTSLDSLIRAGRKLEPVDVIGLLRQLASVLDYAHAHGSLHGSLHPNSILLNERNEIKVLDLGAPATVGRFASPEQLQRAIHFLSPECIRDQPMDGRSDQFSLAALAHRMLTGELPFSGKPLGVMFRIAYQGLERDAMRELPPAAQSVLQRALAKHPAQRYPTCGEMAEALANAFFRAAPAATRVASVAEFAAVERFAAIAAPAPKPATVSPSGVKRHFSREALKYFGITFVVCALVLAAVFYFLMPKAPPKPAPVAPVVTQPAPSPQAVQPVSAQPVSAHPPPPPQSQEKVPDLKTKAPAKAAHAKKKETEVDVRPAEPKIIRQ